MDNISPLVSIVIPNWNGAHHLPVCLNALRKQTYRRIEVIVVDNASTDGSLKLLSENYPEILQELLLENRGFTGACNAGMDRAQGDIVILLNNDTEVEPDWVAEVVAAFERHPEAGIVASKMLLFDRRDTLHNAGDIYRINGLPGNRGVWQKDSERYNIEEYVFSACGGSSAYRRTMLDQIGQLPEEFFFSCEDIDLAWRAQLAGWRCVYAPKAVVYHRLAATGGGVTASYYDGRNFIWVIVRNYPGALLYKNLWRIIKAQMKIAWDALRAWRGEAARARLRGMWVGLISVPALLKSRRKIQASRKVDLATIESLLSSEEAQ